MISDLVIKTPGEINQRGGVGFRLNLDGYELDYEILHTWEDLFQLSFSSSNASFNMLDNIDKYTETMHRADMISMFDDIAGYMLDKTMFPNNYYEEE